MRRKQPPLNESGTGEGMSPIMQYKGTKDVFPSSDISTWVQEKIRMITSFRSEDCIAQLPDEFHMPPLLEDKIDQVTPKDFLDQIAISDETRQILSSLSVDLPQSMTGSSFFLNTITEQTRLKNLVKGLIPLVDLTADEEQDIVSKIMIGKEPIDIRVYRNILREFYTLPSCFQVIGSLSEWHLSLDSTDAGGIRQYYHDECILLDSNLNIVGVFFVDNKGSFLKLCSRLLDEGRKCPEAWKYLTYMLTHHMQLLSHNAL